jgi:glycolate oxidase FAD binding subunit
VAPETLLPEGEMERWRTGPEREGCPAAVLAPSSEEELAGVLAKASEEGWRVLPAGFGNWLQGGGPADVRLVVSTGKLNKIQEYEPADLTFTAGAGLSLEALSGATGPHGQWLPLDPPGGRVGSLGAVVALGTGGPLRHLYGTPRDHVLGLTLVSGDGQILRWGGRVVKNVAGFDLTRLSIGSWGSLGVVTSVSARLFPIPDMDVTLVVRGLEMSGLLLSAGLAMARSSLPLAAVELFDSLEAGGPALVVRLLGSRAQVPEMEARINADLSGHAGNTDRLGREESRALHRTLGDWEKGAAMVARLCLLPSELGILLDEAEGLRALATGWSTPGARVALSAHVGAGVVRLGVSDLPEAASALDPWVATLRHLRERVEGKGGSLTLSSGPAFLMREVGPWGVSDGGRDLMAGLKAQFDPAGILAPGRLGLS